MNLELVDSGSTEEWMRFPPDSGCYGMGANLQRSPPHLFLDWACPDASLPKSRDPGRGRGRRTSKSFQQLACLTLPAGSERACNRCCFKRCKGKMLWMNPWRGATPCHFPWLTSAILAADTSPGQGCLYRNIMKTNHHVALQLVDYITLEYIAPHCSWWMLWMRNSMSDLSPGQVWSGNFPAGEMFFMSKVSRTFDQKFRFEVNFSCTLVPL